MTDALPTVCILAAGRGRRMGRMSEHINKALIPVAYQPALSRIIGKFPPKARFVVALGYKSDLIRDYIHLAHPGLDVTYVDVADYDGAGSGPGTSLQCCKPRLPGPFWFTTCDTLVDESLPDVDGNWVGVAPHPDVHLYCSMGLDDSGRVQRIDYAQPVPGNLVFIGLAGIYDTAAFWEALESNRDLIQGERQVANGLRGLLTRGITGRTFTWHDTGTIENWKNTNTHYGGDFKNFDKETENLYFVNGHVIKYFSDASIAKARVQRNRLLAPLCPAVDTATEHFYRYPFIEGRTLAEVVDDPTFERFLLWCKSDLWKAHDLPRADLRTFQEKCLAFYRDKTLDRLALFHKQSGVPDRSETINGYAVGTTRSLLDRIDWPKLSEGIPVRFHGDLHLDNTVVPSDRGQGSFKLLDWRQDFSGLLEYGDWYYDLAKLHHELILSHQDIKRDAYDVRSEGTVVRFSYVSRSELLSCMRIFKRHVKSWGLDESRVLLLTHLIFLNMSPLHHHPFGLLLYYMGKLGLHQFLLEGRTDL